MGLEAYLHMVVFQLFVNSVCTFKCVLGLERCKNTGDLHSILCLNTSRLDTDGGLKLLLLIDTVKKKQPVALLKASATK